MKAQDYSENMHVGGLRAQIIITKVREDKLSIAPQVEIRMHLPNDIWHSWRINEEPFGDFLLNHLSATEMLVDIEDTARKLVALGCENAEGVYRAAVGWALSGWRNRMEMEILRHEYDPTPALSDDIG